MYKPRSGGIYIIYNYDIYITCCEGCGQGVFVFTQEFLKNILESERVCRDIYQNRKKQRNKMGLAIKLNTTST